MMKPIERTFARGRLRALYLGWIMVVVSGCVDSGSSSNAKEKQNQEEAGRTMRVFEIKPLEGAGVLALGMTRGEVLTAWGDGHPDPFERGDSKIDGFLGNSVQVNYDQAGRVEFIEFARDDDVAAIYQGIDLLRTPAAEVVKKISKITPYDPDDSELGYTYEFPALELRFWRPAEENRFFSSVGVGRKGYSD